MPVRQGQRQAGWAGAAWSETGGAPPHPDDGARAVRMDADPESEPVWRPLALLLRNRWLQQTLGTILLVGLAFAATRAPGRVGVYAREGVAWALGHDVDLAALERQTIALGDRLGISLGASVPAAGVAAVPAGAGLAAAPGRLAAPVAGPVTAWFGWRDVAGRTRFEPNLDWTVAAGTPVMAAADGTVAVLSPQLVLDHAGGWQSVYDRCAPTGLRLGQSVRRGQTVCRALGGDFAFELLRAGQAVDPAPYLGLRPAATR